MYLELSDLDKDSSKQDVTQSAFAVVEYKIDTLVVPSTYLVHTYDILKDQNIYLATPIDSPNGQSLTTTRVHAIINAVKRGAKLVDLVINQNLLIDREFDKLQEDAAACQKACLSNGAILRVVIDYRRLKTEQILHLCHLLGMVGVQYIVTSTLTTLDNWIDNLIMAYEIQEKTSLFAIVATNNFINLEKFKNMESSGIFGFRFHSVSAIEQVFGV